MQFVRRLALVVLSAGPLAAQGVHPPAPQCSPAPKEWPDARAWLTRARAALGFPVGDSVLSFRSTELSWFIIQSDRSYPPFALTGTAREIWFDPASGVERTGTPGPAGMRGGILTTNRAAWVARDSVLTPQPQLFATYRAVRFLNPWAALADFERSADVHVTGRCQVRDYARVAISRKGAVADEHLYLDPVSAFPVMVSVEEPHYLWGRIRADYLYSTWFADRIPVTAHRLVDGVMDAGRSYDESRLVPRDSAPGLRVPADAPDMRSEIEAFLRPDNPDTIGVGPATWLLRNRGYIEAVTLVKDTIWVLDATQGEARARADSAWIGRLFPGRHPVAVVVTDLAWPHIAGLRFWAAAGATIISHRLSRGFLQQVLARKWTEAPDAFERQRPRALPGIRVVNSSTAMAGGAIRLIPLEGVGSEGALGAWLPGERFFWASDYFQRLDRPTLYAREIARTLADAGITPERIAAQHLPLTAWSTVTTLLGLP